VIAKPAAWRLAPAPPLGPMADDGPSEHAHLIAAGLPREADGVDVREVEGTARGRWDRSPIHEHDVAELNLVVPITTLRCEVVLGDERYDVEGPASIVVPAGLPHSLNVTAGRGFFVSVMLGDR
jgi:hypothetical protein